MSQEKVKSPLAGDNGTVPSSDKSILVEALAHSITAADETGDLFFLATPLWLLLERYQTKPITIIELKTLIAEAAKAMESE